MLPEAKRIKFTKTGRMQFISHLDLNRVMRTALIRAGIPIYYSEGFNPHPKMVFALPLSIGAESECELLDIKIIKEMPNDEIKERLSKELPCDMSVVNVTDNNCSIAYGNENTHVGGLEISQMKKSVLSTKGTVVVKHREGF